MTVLDVIRALLSLQLIAYVAMLLAVAVFLAVSTIAHGPELVGIAIIASIVLCAGRLIAWRLVRRANGDPTDS